MENFGANQRGGDCAPPRVVPKLTNYPAISLRMAISMSTRSLALSMPSAFLLESICAMYPLGHLVWVFLNEVPPSAVNLLDILEQVIGADIFVDGGEAQRQRGHKRRRLRSTGRLPPPSHSSTRARNPPPVDRRCRRRVRHLLRPQ